VLIKRVSIARVPVVVIVPPVIPVAVFVATELTEPLLLNVVQSVELKAPLLVAEAVGKLKVCVAVAELILKSVPDVPVTKY
jgi:hypothetical protein